MTAREHLLGGITVVVLRRPEDVLEVERVVGEALGEPMVCEHCRPRPATRRVGATDTDREHLRCEACLSSASSSQPSSRSAASTSA